MHLISEQQEPASIFLVAVDPEKPDRLPWQVLAVIRAADAVFFDSDIAGQISDLCGPRCHREVLSSDKTAADLAPLGEIARMRKLAADGWRVVRIIAAPASVVGEVERLEAAGINVGVLSGLGRGESRPYPELFATSLTGLAG